MKLGLFELNAILAVARHANFRRAADALSLSPSSLSRLISAVEADFGERLFFRTTRKVSLTPTGARLIKRLTPALREIEHALGEVSDAPGEPSGQLRIVASSTAAELFLATYLTPFQKRFPRVQVEIVGAERVTDIVGMGADAGILPPQLTPQGMVIVPLIDQWEWCVVASPAYLAAAGQPETPDDLHRHFCLRHRYLGNDLFLWEFGKGAERIQMDPDARLIVGENHLLVSAALNGLGIARVPCFMIQTDIKEGRLIRLLESYTPRTPEVCLFYPANRQLSSALRALIELMVGISPG